MQQTRLNYLNENQDERGIFQTRGATEIVQTEKLAGRTMRQYHTGSCSLFYISADMGQINK